MRISDWSSDVCSSDLILLTPFSNALNHGELAKQQWINCLTLTQSIEAHELYLPCCLEQFHPALGCSFRTCPHKRQKRSEEHTSELQSLMRISYEVCCLHNKKLIRLIFNSII